MSLFPESRYSCCTSHHYSSSRRGHRLFQAIYELGHLHYDKEATKVQARCVLLPGSTGIRNLDVYRLCLYRGKRGPVPGQSVQPLRMEPWRPGWDQRPPDTPRPTKRLWHLQFLVVFSGSLYAAGLRHFSKVGQHQKHNHFYLQAPLSFFSILFSQ